MQAVQVKSRKEEHEIDFFLVVVFVNKDVTYNLPVSGREQMDEMERRAANLANENSLSKAEMKKLAEANVSRRKKGEKKGRERKGKERKGKDEIKRGNKPLLI